MSDIKLYHNPRCSKSRQALALLEERGIEATVVEYLKQPPNLAALQSIAKKLKTPVASMVRVKDGDFKSLAIDVNDDDALLKAIAENPKLLERPIVESSKLTIVGRPVENILEVLS